MKRTSEIVAVSVPPEAARDFRRIAEREGRNKSELFRETLRVYRSQRERRELEGLQRYGARRARESGVTEEDVERLIREYRRESRGGRRG